MAYFDWNEEKNQKLKEERGVSFEEILTAIDEDGLLDVIEHPNRKRYRGQKIMVVRLGEYIYLVPFVKDPDKIFLKTIIPSRRATKKYLVENKNKKK